MPQLRQLPLNFTTMVKRKFITLRFAVELPLVAGTNLPASACSRDGAHAFDNINDLLSPAGSWSRIWETISMSFFSKSSVNSGDLVVDMIQLDELLVREILDGAKNTGIELVRS